MEVVYAIPGLGTTKELFENIVLPRDYTLKVLEWPVPKAGQSLQEYAREFLSQIDTSAPVNLMGVSFGGMLCCELAELTHAKKVVLISSCKNSTELPSSIRLLNYLPLQNLLSERLYRRFVGRISRTVGFEQNYLPRFIRMMRSMPPGYFRHCVNMIIRWNRKNNTRKIYHLHGNADTLLPHSRVQNCELIETGNHAMVVYRSEEINVFLNKVFNGL